MSRSRFFVPILAGVATLLVAGCGDDDSSGPQGPADDGIVNFPAEAATLQDAIDLAKSGDTIVVAAGTHVIDEELSFSGTVEDVTLKGEDGSRPTLSFALTVTPTDGDAITTNARGLVVENLEIEGSYRVGVLFFASGGVVKDCILRDAAWYSVSCPASLANPTVEDCILENAGIFGIHAVSGADPTVQRCTIVGAGDCGIYANNAGGTYIRNIIVQSENYGIACFGGSSRTIDCNVLYDNVTADYSIDCVPGASDLHADPLFCDPAAYTLLVGSPCTEANAGACGGIGAVQEVCAITGP